MSLGVFLWVSSPAFYLTSLTCGKPPILTTHSNCVKCAHSPLSYPFIPWISKLPNQIPSPQSHILAVSWCLFFFLPDILLFTVLSQTFSRLFLEITYNTSYEYVLKCTCVRYLVVHVTDPEPSVHMYWSDTASQTALQLPREDGRTSGLLHITTDGTRYTEHTVDVHSNRT